MSKNTCKIYPDAPNGKPSEMYKKMLERIGDRSLTNWMYASYIVTKAGDKMDQNGYARNSQGEHDANDVLNFLDFSTIEQNIANLSMLEMQLGAIDTNGKRIEYTNAEDALRKADNFNSNHKGVSAIVAKYGDVYNIIVNEKNSKTNMYAEDVKNKLQIWDVYKQVFNNVGIDITAMPQELNNVFNAFHTGLAQYLKNLGQMQIKYLSRNDALTLFSLNSNSPHVKRLVSAFGSIEDAAQAIEDMNHGNANLSKPQQTLLMRAITDSKKFQGVDIDALITQVNQMSKNLYATSPEQAIKDEIHKLNKKYKIDIFEIHRVSDEIRTLSEAASDAAVVLQRQIRKLEKERGNNPEGKRLVGILSSLMKELASKRYYSGIMNFLNEASTQIADIDNMLLNIPQTGTELEKAFGTAKILRDIQSLREQYYPLVEALADEHLTIDEAVSQADIDNIRQSAQKLKEFFDKKKSMLKKLAEGTMTNMMLQIVGTTTPDGQSVVNAVRMAATDSTIYNYLYSVGRASNPIIATAGSIIRNAQDGRDKIINDINLRIRRATNNLYKAGYNSEFMYEDDGHIASDINWELYNNARSQYKKSLIAQGLRGFDLKQAIEDWEDHNTEDRVVDKTNGRTERVPNQSFRKINDFQEGWSPEQKEYYDIMMQLKGEIGSLLPAYAQKQYLPPQVRRKFLDAVNDASNISDVLKAVKNKAMDLYTVREDDDNYSMNGIIEGEEYGIVEGGFDNTPLRQIPIFFVNKVEQGELLKNFSTGLAALAGTAVNYEAMNSVIDAVEFIGDFVKEQKSRDKHPKADMVQNKAARVFKALHKRATNTNTASLIDGFISQHIYGEKRDPNENKTMAKIFSSIIAYTSFKGLATNVKGAFANYLMGEFQMLIEAGAGEFYGFKDFFWAHSKLFGGSGVYGDMAELLTNNVNHKGVLMRELFDPLQENFSNKSHKTYYKSMFRQLVAHDCSFIGYSSGEYLIHYVNMYSYLHHTKVLLNGNKISLYDAFEVTNKQDGNSELTLKAGVTDLNGNTITDDYIDKVRRTIRGINQSTHGAMNDEDKGLIHRSMWGRGIMNFRQWMVGHYSRRYRTPHYDAAFGMVREGYWYTLYKGLVNDNTKDTWKSGHKRDAIGLFMKDFYTFMFRAQSQWSNLNDMQKYNIKRVKTEMMMYIALLGLGFVLGEEDEHKREFWRRWWIYQTKRMILDTEASMPHPRNPSNWLTIMNSPMASLNTMNSLLYMFYGLFNGDIVTDIKSGDHKGQNKYWRNVVKYDLPFFKDWEQMQKMDTDDSVFKIFESSPSNH